MAKNIGIFGGNHVDVAAQIKAQILQRDPSAVVSIDAVPVPHDAPDEHALLEDKKIMVYEACRRLIKNGANLIAFACGCPHSFLPELQKEFTVRLVDPMDEDGNRLEPADYAEAILCADPAPLPKPFKIGMIGGLGPAATVDLYAKITKFTPAKCDQDHFKLVVEQDPTCPDRTKALLEGGTDPLLTLYDCSRRLEDDGCDCLIIPCNTAHAFAPYMQKHLGIPFINMQQATMDEIKAKLGDKARIGLMATRGTVQSGIYSAKAKAMDLPLFVPDEPNQDKVMDAIYGPVGVKAGITTGKCHDELVAAAEYLVKTYDCNVLILGCTELPLILDEGDMEIAGKKVFIIDPTSALARKVVRLAQEETEKRGVH